MGSQAKKVQISKLKVSKPIQDHIQASFFQERRPGCEEMDAKWKKSGGRGLEGSKYAKDQTWRLVQGEQKNFDAKRRKSGRGRGWEEDELAKYVEDQARRLVEGQQKTCLRRGIVTLITLAFLHCVFAKYVEDQAWCLVQGQQMTTPSKLSTNCQHFQELISVYTIGPIGLSGKFLKDETNFTLIIVQIRIDFVKYQRTSDWQKNLIFRRWQSLPRAVLKAMRCQISSEM